MARNFIFKSERMLDRIKKEGKENLLDDETRDFIISLDGAEGTDHNWEFMVKDAPLVYLTEKKTYVNIEDCIEI